MKKTVEKISNSRFGNNSPPFFKKVRNFALLIFIISVILVPDDTMFNFTQNIEVPFQFNKTIESWIIYVRWAASFTAGTSHLTKQ